jgi:L-asparaginase
MRPVTVLAAGGTIAMAGPAGQPAAPALDAGALGAAVPGLADVPGLRARSVTGKPGALMTAADALAVARAAAAEADAGRGVVVTHGTDTLEETAFLCDLLYGGAAPIVFTGAMRPSSAAGADGPANLLDAVAVASSEAAAGLGVLVTFAGELHAARAVRKGDATGPAAFLSPGLGPLGHAGEGRVALAVGVPRRPPLAVTALDATVHVIVAGLGSDGRLAEAALSAGADGLVAVLLGAGHCPPGLLPVLGAAPVPVVATVRPERSAILHATYGFPGAEGDVRASTVIPAGSLSPAAARIKLMACLGARLDRAGIAAAFAPDDV